jgi:poly-gamma-glutamate capsule biosynthesis protein CapA/YwtB (metallophosphatase superfamily)
MKDLPGEPDRHAGMQIKKFPHGLLAAFLTLGAVLAQPMPAAFSYVWGDALAELDRRKPDLRLINLETSITASNDYWKDKGDIAVASIHWGGNWGYEISGAQKRFAQRLIDEADVDVIHGHSSHHVKGIEVYKDKLILYGCGDFINDYEGIGGYEEFRADLSFMYFATIDPASGKLSQLQMIPTQIPVCARGAATFVR